MKFQFLVENKTNQEGILAEHGLSIFIETEEKKILFDAGASDAFAVNADRMGVDLAGADLAVISHGHYDHTGGVPLFCRINLGVPVYLHKNAFRLSHGMEKGEIEEKMCGIRWTEEQKKALESRIRYTDGSCRITENIALTGTIPVPDDFQPSERFYYYNINGEPVEDDMSHEQCLVIREPEGLYVFSGCSHRGVIPALQEAMRLFPREKIVALIAGMHLYSASRQTREKTVEEVLAQKIDRIFPVHCTGMDALCDLRQALGERCVIAMAGDSFETGADREGD